VRCPSCGASDDKVVDSREIEEGGAIRRRRECLGCRARFSTVERVTGSPLFVLKRSGERESFSREKLVAGIGAACKNRPVRREDVEQLASAVEDELRRHGTVVPSEQIGVAVLERLSGLDEVAYLRFASVYKGFANAGDFAREAGLLGKKTEPKRKVGGVGAVPSGS